jgi:hypothetical protein
MTNFHNYVTSRILHLGSEISFTIIANNRTTNHPLVSSSILASNLHD